MKDWYYQYKDDAVLEIMLSSNKYDHLADGCHSICYETGAHFEWMYPENPGVATAIFSFRTTEQKEAAIQLLYDLIQDLSDSDCILYETV